MSVFDQTSQGAVRSYDARVAGRYVHDTLMDAFGFFAYCDPCVAKRDAAGQLVGFPLPPLQAPGYERLVPDWPDHETVDARIRADAQSQPPGGSSREVHAVLVVNGTEVVCGYTQWTGGTDAFTEAVEQVIHDIQKGYTYTAMTTAGARRVEDRGDSKLHVDGTAFADLDFDDPPTPLPPPWEDVWQMCVDDADYYRRQRRSGG